MLGIAAGAPDFILAASNRRAQDLATDDAFWFQVRQAFTVDGQYLALNAGANNTMARPVLEAWQQYTELHEPGPVDQSAGPRRAARGGARTARNPGPA